MSTILNWLTTGSDGWILTLQFEISCCHSGDQGESPSFGTSYRADWFIHTGVSVQHSLPIYKFLFEGG